MAEALVARYWCHMCSQMVNPVLEAEIKCPFCDGGFVEEMGEGDDVDDLSMGSDRSLSLWAPILLGMIGGRSRRQRSRREDDYDENEDSDEDRDSRSILRRRRRSSAIVQLLRSLRDDSRPDSENLESFRERNRDSLILINAFNQSVILQGSFDEDSNRDQTGSSLGDYYVGPGLDLLLQHLAENDPNRYGTPPAKKEVVDSLPSVKIAGNASCPVCLDDFEIGAEGREMPCKHRFHSGCILPWLELHSSCPVCRFQLPADESKGSNANSGIAEGRSVNSGDGGNGRGNGGRSWAPVPWPFNGLFSSSGSQTGGNSSSNPSSSSGSGSRADEN